MSEYSSSALFLSHLISFSRFIFSHSLYISYFIFFSPYLFKLLNFLSPLFVTTSLSLLVLITTTTLASNMDNSAESNLSFFVITYHRLMDTLHSKIEEEVQNFPCFEDLEAYKIVFETSVFEIGENPGEILKVEDNPDGTSKVGVNPDGILKIEDKEMCFTISESKIERYSSSDSFGTGVSEVLNDELEEYQFESTMPEIKKLECLLQEKEESVCHKESKIEVSVENKMSLDKVSDEMSQRVTDCFKSSTDSELEYADYRNYVDKSPTTRANSLGNFGSMRTEKEWRRTLACKLFEERHNHNVNGSSEGMDSLWETYESDSMQHSKIGNSKTKKSSSSSSNRSRKDLYDLVDNGEEEEEDDIYDGGQFCCLQALKFSAGKMNLGMKKPNLAKLSKVLKGIRWLHRVSSKHGKKVYH